MNDLNTESRDNKPSESETQQNGGPAPHQHNKPNILQVVLSTLAAAFGVQSNKNRERDFQSGSLTTYIVSGIIFTVLFVFAVIFVVRLVLAGSGL